MRRKCNKSIGGGGGFIFPFQMLQNIVSSCLDGECPRVSVEVCEINLVVFGRDELVLIGLSIVH